MLAKEIPWIRYLCDFQPKGDSLLTTGEQGIDFAMTVQAMLPIQFDLIVLRGAIPSLRAVP